MLVRGPGDTVFTVLARDILLQLDLSHLKFIFNKLLGKVAFY